MYQFFKSALIVAVVAGSTAFQSASAALSRAPLPFAVLFKTNPQGFSVELSPVQNEESVRFTVKNFSGNRLRCSLKAPDGSLLETVYIQAKTGEASRNYRFASADEGVYTIEVTDGKEKIVKKIDLHRTVALPETQFIIK